jgi:hypothetical protein
MELHAHNSHFIFGKPCKQLRTIFKAVRNSRKKKKKERKKGRKEGRKKRKGQNPKTATCFVRGKKMYF